MLYQTSSKSASGLYNFLADTASVGGPGFIGTVNLGVHLPIFAVITGFWVTQLVNITSGGAATLSFGTITTDIVTPTSTVNNLMTATAIASFTAQPLLGVDLNAAPLRLVNSVDVTMSIATANLTAGQLYFLLTYDEFVR